MGYDYPKRYPTVSHLAVGVNPYLGHGDPMDDSPDMKVRMPANLRAKIKDAADEAGRSLNAEIRMRLEWSFGETGFDGQASDDMMANEIESLRNELRQSVGELKAEIEALKDRSKS